MDMKSCDLEERMWRVCKDFKVIKTKRNAYAEKSA